MPGRSEIVPSASRLITSLRGVGYDLGVAVADLVDNSVAANATEVDIDMAFDGPDSWIRIADNGWGMSPSELREAMRFGTRRQYGDHDLGRYGLGLKAASLSQCRCLTVATRTSPSGRVSVGQWDLDHVEESDRWEILHPGSGAVPLAAEPLREAIGTVVVWEDLDRVFRHQLPDGKRATADFERAITEVQEHLAMVFHRFLSGEAARRLPLRIRLNGGEVEPWDPYARSEPDTLVLPAQRLTLVRNGRQEIVRVRPYVLPPEARFTSSAAHRRSAGPKRWNRQQGFYVYRADRLIQAGGWCRLRTADEHSKLARVSIDVPPGGEDLFDLNISKTQIRVPDAIRADLAAIASSIAQRAQEVYRAPSMAPIEARGSVGDDPRIRAIASIVELVLNAVDGVMGDEVSDAATRMRVGRRLRAMQASLVDDLRAELGAGAIGGAVEVAVHTDAPIVVEEARPGLVVGVKR